MHHIICSSLKWTVVNKYFAFLIQVLSKGVIVHHGHEKVEVEDSLEARKGKILLNLSIVAEMAPVMHIVVYSVLPSKRVIAARKTFDVEKCFSNKVM